MHAMGAVTLEAIETLLRQAEDREPRIIELLTPEEAAAERAAGARVYRVLSRVSDDKLLSIPQQVKECIRYAWGETVASARRPDLAARVVVDKVYNLGEQSGFSISESLVMQQLLKDARAEPWNALVARDSSRLGRDYWEKMGTIRDLRAAGIELHVIEDGGFFDYEDSINKVKSFANTWADEGKKLEEIRKSMRATAALREMGFPTTSVPYGYAPSVDPLSRRPVWVKTPDAEKVRAIFDAFLADPSLEQVGVARHFGISKQLLRKVLRNRAYTGGFTWGGRFVRCEPPVIPPIVTEEEFERIQQTVVANGRKIRRRPRPDMTPGAAVV
jgi:DNA invertase Pin-like site-specific DNA recombinase